MCSVIIVMQLIILSHSREMRTCPVDKRKLVDGPQQFYEICDGMTRIYQIFGLPEIPLTYYRFSTK